MPLEARAQIAGKRTPRGFASGNGDIDGR
jgi:hypothetical protein